MWDVFKNGKIICSFDGDVIPTSEYIDYYLKENGNEELFIVFFACCFVD